MTTLEQYREITGYKLPLALYARISRDKKEAVEQKQTLIDYAKSQDREYILYYDELSGKHDDRQDYQLMLARFKSKEHDECIVTKVDRFSRNLLNGLNGLKVIIVDANGIFRAISQGIDSTSPFNLDMIKFMLLLAEIEGRGITDRIHAGQDKYRDKNTGKLNCNPGNKNCTKHVLTESTLEKIAKWEKAGLKVSQIARICEISRQAVYDGKRINAGEVVERRGQVKKPKTNVS